MSEPSDPELAEGAGPTEWAIPGQVGVGPWPGGRPAWPADERYDPELLEHGDRRNVVDAYRYWRREAVAADLATRGHPFHVAIENFAHDHNIGTVVRTANAFAAAGVHIVGRRRWNRRGAMVTDRYQQLHHHPDVAGVRDFATTHGLVLVAVDNTPGAAPLETTELPRSALLLFGQEGPGLTPEAREAAELVVSIAQFGSTRSINAGVAAGIAMHAWVRAHGDLSRAW
ncbi:MAG: RNA methyltransferase [Pseudonocardia sp.]|nr:RNA methyltransferase [Pseudonocardia sp.]